MTKREQKRLDNLDEFDLEAEREGMALHTNKESASIFKPKSKHQGMKPLTFANANRVFNNRINCKYVSRSD